jgi:hypothetical protein
MVQHELSMRSEAVDLVGACQRLQLLLGELLLKNHELRCEVARLRDGLEQKAPEASGPPIRIKDENGFYSATSLPGSAALPFVISTGAQRSGEISVWMPLLGNVFRRSVPGFPTSPLWPATTHVVLRKENHTHLIEVTTLDRKSGGAEGSAVPRTSLEMFSTVRDVVERPAVHLWLD